MFESVRTSNSIASLKLRYDPTPRGASLTHNLFSSQFQATSHALPLRFHDPTKIVQVLAVDSRVDHSGGWCIISPVWRFRVENKRDDVASKAAQTESEMVP